MNQKESGVRARVERCRGVVQRILKNQGKFCFTQLESVSVELRHQYKKMSLKLIELVILKEPKLKEAIQKCKINQLSRILRDGKEISSIK